MSSQRTSDKMSNSDTSNRRARFWENLSRVSSPSRKQTRRRRLNLEQMEERRLLTVVDLASLLSIEGTTFYGMDAGDYSGARVTGIGDLNGDGNDDFFIGVGSADSVDNLRENAGEAHIVFGNDSIFGNDSPLPSSLDLNNLGTLGITIFGADSGDRMGRAANAGDLNGDGITDLILSALEADSVDNQREGAGESYIIFGGASLPPTIDLATPGTSNITIYGKEAGDRLGQVSGAGDVNADGYDDIVLGADLASDTGESYVIFGEPDWPSTIDLADAGSADILLTGAGYYVGYRVGDAGDMNNDGKDDFIVSSQRANGVGECYVIFGDEALSETSTIDLDNLEGIGVTIRGKDGQSLGRALDKAGDVNGDGFDDVVLGAQDSNTPSENYIVYGGSSLPDLIEVANLGASGVTLSGVKTNWGVSGAGDVNGDGYDDVIVAAGSANAGTGATYIVFGGDNLPDIVDILNMGSAGVTLLGVDAGDGSGTFVGRAGDVNSDGYGDILIGANSGEGRDNIQDNVGETYLIYGGQNFPGVAGIQTIFEESFEVAEWNGTWVEDNQNDWSRSTQRASGNSSWSAEIDGRATNATLELSQSLDLSGIDSSRLTFDWYIESAFDSGEYVALDISTDGGANWIEGVRQLNGNQSQEDTWHSELVILDAFATEELKIRFRASVSSSKEDANVDNIRIVGTAMGPNDSPAADAGGPYNVAEGTAIQLDATGSSDPDGSIASYAWDFDGDGLYDDATGATPNYTETDSGVHVVAVQVTDNRGATDTSSAMVTVSNVAPTADAGGDATGSVDTVLNLSAAASSDPGNDIVAYAWDLDNDGQYDDATGVEAAFSSSVTGVYIVGLQVTDADGASSIDSISITIDEAQATPAIYVGDIHDVFETRQRGRKNTDHRLVIDVLQDDGNGIADAGDFGIGGVYVVVELFDSNDNLVTTLDGYTDSNGVFRSDWIRNLDTGDYRADVVDLALAGFTWDPFLDLEDDELLSA